MSRRNRFVLMAAGLFVGLAVVENIRSTEPFDLLTFAADLFETALLAGAVAMTAYVSAESRDMRIERLELIDDLDQAKRDGSRWRDAARTHVAGLSQAISAQFRNWALTEAEADVATLMLKGLTHKEIAILRQCSEATVRQHATVVYRKSGLTSRSQLTAFFLEDLLAPSEGSPPVALVKVQRG